MFRVLPTHSPHAQPRCGHIAQHRQVRSSDAEICSFPGMTRCRSNEWGHLVLYGAVSRLSFSFCYLKLCHSAGLKHSEPCLASSFFCGLHCIFPITSLLTESLKKLTWRSLGQTSHAHMPHSRTDPKVSAWGTRIHLYIMTSFENDVHSIPRPSHMPTEDHRSEIRRAILCVAWGKL